MSVKDLYSAKRKKTSPEEDPRRPSAENRDLKEFDVPKTKKLRVDRTKE
ncbi:MAG: hypothetical protein PXY39_04840 [archaeon]|nr:hypothetical protein [archaeon]